jgi:hypothetical protein
MARLPLAEKLRWLEEAHRLIRHLERRRAGDSKGGSATA